MGILDNIAGGRPFLQNQQSLFGQQPPMAPPQNMAPQIAPPPQPPQQGGAQQGGAQQQGTDIGTILKIMAMFGGA